MNRVRWTRVAVVVGLLGCGADEPLVAGRSGDKVAVDAGSAGAGRDAAVSKSEDGDDVDDDDVDDDQEESPRVVSGARDGGATVNNCGQQNVRTEAVVPDMLIVLDRSGSMKPDARTANLRCDNLEQLDPFTQVTRFAECLGAGIDCNTDRDRNTVNCGGTEVRSIDRWTPSVAAIKKLTSEFDSDLSFGLLPFPGEGGGRGNNGSCTPGSLQVPIRLGQAAAIAAELDGTEPGGGTPTGQALQTALEEFRKLDASDVAKPARYVLLVTDGQPTCPSGEGGGRQGALAADKQLTLDALDALRDEGVTTFVIGYDAALDPGLAESLTEFAQHGGTDRYYAVQDEASLSEAFTAISSVVIRCDVELQSSFVSSDYVNVALDGDALMLDDPNGWRLEDKTVIVQGAACDKLQEGKGHRVDITIECVSPM